MDGPKKIFYRNYDLYDSKTGPGAGWHSMHKYKSIKEFLEAKRKRNKKKKKAQELRIKIFKKAMEFNGSIGLTGYFPYDDFEGKSPDELNFGHDYQESEKKDAKPSKALMPTPAPLKGIPDGMEEEEKDADKTKNNMNPYYGTTNLHNLTYEKL